MENPLNNLKDDFLKKAEKIRERFPKKLCSPDIAWDLLCQKLEAR